MTSRSSAAVIDLALSMSELDLVTDGYWVWNLEDPTFEYLSPGFWASLGYDHRRMPHSPDSWKDKINADDGARALSALDGHMKTGAPYRIVVRYRHSDGHDVWILCRGTAVPASAGMPAHMLGVHQDVTQLAGCPRVGPCHVAPLQGIGKTGDRLLASVEAILGLLDEAQID